MSQWYSSRGVTDFHLVKGLSTCMEATQIFYNARALKRLIGPQAIKPRLDWEPQRAAYLAANNANREPIAYITTAGTNHL